MKFENNIILHEQEYDYSCGPGTLLMLYRGLGIFTTEDQINKEMNIDEEGASWSQMYEHIKSKNLSCTVERNASWEQLLQNTSYPRIICYSTTRCGEPGSHFSLVCDMDDESITLADPGFGDMYVLGRKEFLDQWFDDEGAKTFLVVKEVFC